MRYKDREEFRKAWDFYADHWYDPSKVTEFNSYMFLYSGPRADICFLTHVKLGNYDNMMSAEAKEFFMDNIDSPFMKELYPTTFEIMNSGEDSKERYVSYETGKEFIEEFKKAEPKTQDDIENFVEEFFEKHNAL